MSSGQGVNFAPLFKDLHGFYISSSLDEDAVRSALSYKPRSDDIFIVTYPKSGTTWTQYIVHCILNDGALPKDFTELTLMSPWLEFLGTEAAEKMARPGAIKCHLPFHKQPYSEKAKYTCVARNPYDCCDSFYYHCKGIPHYGVADSNFDQFLELFLARQVGCGEYFDNLVSWYEHRKGLNVLFLRYEDLKKNTAVCVLKIADFLGEEYGQNLRTDDSLLEKVVKFTSLEGLKKQVNDGAKEMIPNLLALPPERQLKSLQIFGQKFSGKEMFVQKGNFVRKGIPGDYKNHFSPEDIQRMKDWIAFRTT
ncbi:sulfotransferase ssu-1-like [Ixodes scapularis]|uniref:sulfotransferase ssu-1-like n=1 Tax=Ixodes scapularis TaxID=6945 RepID=UPI001A9D7FB2|nr:sulfotransferase ssu-1-like [Ixodes scapularis]